MYEPLWQTVAALGRLAPEDGQWIQLLVFIFIIVVYGLRTLIGAKAKAGSQARHDESSPDARPIRPAHKPALPGLKPAQAGRPSPLLTPPLRPKPTPRKAAPRPGLARQHLNESVFDILEPLQDKRRPVVPQPAPDLPEFPTFTRKAVQQLTPKGTSALIEPPELAYLSDSLLDDSDPHALMKAVLHYEILATPIALRNRSHDLIGL
jgi:hypothetical protein